MTTERWPLPWHSEGENTLERCPRCKEMDIYFHAKFSRVDIYIFFLNLIKHEELEDLFALGTAQTGPRHFSAPHFYLHVKRSIQWLLKSLPTHASFVLYTPMVSTNSTTKKIQKKSIIQYMILNFREFRYKYWLTSILYKMWKPLEECFESKP